MNIQYLTPTQQTIDHTQNPINAPINFLSFSTLILLQVQLTLRYTVQMIQSFQESHMFKSFTFLLDESQR